MYILNCTVHFTQVLAENTGEKLELDLHVARKELREHAVLSVSQGNKDFFDYLHLSPLKVHMIPVLVSASAPSSCPFLLPLPCLTCP